ncbi:MAG: FeoC-like transcriptional regulator [Propionivibrio sp.]
MILARIEQYMRDHRRSALNEMAANLDAAPDAVRNMLGILERKGRVRRLPSGTACGGGCCKCSPETVELYEWNDQAA